MKTRLMTAALVAGLAACVSAQTSSKRDVHFVQQGETLEAIAKSYLGSVDAAGELQAYNHLKDGVAVVAGSPLVIPGQDRTDAVAVLQKADESMEAAIGASASEFATEEYKKALDVMNAAVESRKQASYLQAKTLAELAIELFDVSVTKAGSSAMKGEKARIVATSGDVSIFKKGEWKTVSAKDVPKSGSQLRAEGSGRFVLALPGGDQVAVNGPALLSIESLQQDQRNQRVDSRLQVVRGDLEIAVSSEKAEGSELIVKTGGGEARLDAGLHRVLATGADAAMIVAVDGTAGVLAGESTLSLEPGAAITLEAGSASGMMQAPQPLQLKSPAPGTLKTSHQVVDFTWEAVPGRPAYRVELAADPSFHEVLVNRITREPTYRSDVLSPGKYFFRSSAIVNGVQGAASGIVMLEVGRNLEMKFADLKSSLPGANGLIVGPGTVLEAIAVSEDNSIDSTEYSVDGAEFQSGEGGLKLPETGTFKVRARGVGADGSKGEEISNTFVVDGTTPELRIHIGEVVDFPGYGLIRSLAVLVDDDNKVGDVLYRINNEAAQKYELPLKLPVGSKHHLQVEASDIFGNRAVTSLTLDAAEVVAPVVEEPMGSEESVDEKKRGGLFGIF